MKNASIDHICLKKGPYFYTFLIGILFFIGIDFSIAQENRAPSKLSIAGDDGDLSKPNNRYPHQNTLRKIPENLLFGQIRSIEHDAATVVIYQNKRPVAKKIPLSAALQIRDPLNRLVLPATLSLPASVRFKLDFSNQLWRAWILTEKEHQYHAKQAKISSGSFSLKGNAASHSSGR